MDTTLWTEPALAPTAVIPKLPEKRGASCGYEQLELGDEEQLARYPVLQAIRSGMKLDTESYSRGNYQTVPIVPGKPLPGTREGFQQLLDHWARRHGQTCGAGGTAWTRVVPTLDGAKPQSWLQEYQSDALPSVNIEALGESCFSRKPADTEPPSPSKTAVVSADKAADVPVGPSLTTAAVCTCSSAAAIPHTVAMASTPLTHCAPELRRFFTLRIVVGKTAR